MSGKASIPQWESPKTITCSEFLRAVDENRWLPGSLVGAGLDIAVANLADLPRVLECLHELLREGGKLSIGLEGGDTRSRRMIYLQAFLSRLGFRVISHAEGRVLCHGETAVRWQLSSSSPKDAETCHALFERAFGEVMDALLWQWKYADDRGVALIARRGGTVIAHYGAIKRRILFKGAYATALAIGDVMVEPRERGLLTKKGAFFQVTAGFLELYFGVGQDYRVAYGFPNRRHMLVAERLGLYGEVDTLVEWHWPPLHTRFNLWHGSKVLSRDGDRHFMDKAWELMRGDFQSDVLAIRDADYLHHRYFDHPLQTYTVLGIYNRLSRDLLGVVVLRQEQDSCKLMDVIGPVGAFPVLLVHARQQVGHWKLPRLVAWVPAGKRSLFEKTGGTAHPIDVSIPANTWSQGPELEELRNHWWISFGDTDFL